MLEPENSAFYLRRAERDTWQIDPRNTSEFSFWVFSVRKLGGQSTCTVSCELHLCQTNQQSRCQYLYTLSNKLVTECSCTYTTNSLLLHTPASPFCSRAEVHLFHLCSDARRGSSVFLNDAPCQISLPPTTTTSSLSASISSRPGPLATAVLSFLSLQTTQRCRSISSPKLQFRAAGQQ